MMAKRSILYKILLLTMLLVATCALLSACSLFDSLDNMLSSDGNDGTSSEVSLSLNGALLTLEATSYEYTGANITPSVSSLTLDGKNVPSDGYILSYANNLNVGTATVTAKGRNNYVGSVSKTFSITAKSIASANVTLASTSVTYAGTVTQPQITSVTLGAITLEDKDYTVSVSTSNGTGTMLLTGTGNYTGSVSATFNVVKLSLDDATITLNKQKYKYTGEAITPTVNSVKVGGVTISADNFDVSYSNNVDKSAAALITVTGKNNCFGSADTTFQIVETVTYAVVYNIAGNNSLIAPDEYEPGDELTVPDDSSLEKAGETGMAGYSYVWYADEDFKTRYVFGTMPEYDVTLYGKLTAEQGYSFFASGYGFSTATSINVENFTDLCAVVDLVMFNYVFNSASFYATFGNAAFDSAHSYITVSEDYISTQAELKQAVSDAQDASGYSSNILNGFSFEYPSATSTSFRLYCRYALDDTNTLNTNEQLTKEASKSATTVVTNAGADSKLYSQFNSLNVKFDGAPHEFAIDSVALTVDCTTTNQLCFALEHGIRPNVDDNPDSNAYKAYYAARAALTSICNNSMTDYEKVRAIYAWCVLNIQYDYNAVEASYDSLLGSFVYYDCYYLEGVFGLNRTGTSIAVCDGISKAFVVLCQIEGIDCVRVTGTAGSGSNSGGHAWNKVKLDGKWYIVDATWDGSVDCQYREPSSYVGEYLTFDNFLISDAQSTADTRVAQNANGDIACDYSRNYYDDYSYAIDLDNSGVIEEDEHFDLLIDSVEEFEAMFLYCIYYTDSMEDNIDGYTLMFYVNYSMGEEDMQNALTAAKNVAFAARGYAKNFNTANRYILQSTATNINYSTTVLFTFMFTGEGVVDPA